MLPQRRKSAEEIAKLRESLGIPGEGVPGTGADGAVPADDSPVAERAPAAAPARDLFSPDPEPNLRPAAPPKPVRSLRKSERNPAGPPATPRPAPAEKKGVIPVRRHDDCELMEMRRIQAAPPDLAIAHIRNLVAPWPLVVLGYLLPAMGAFAGWFASWAPGVPEPDFPADWLADLSRAPWLEKAGFATLVAACAAALALAAWLGWKKPRSRHHAGFMVILAILIAVFGFSHYFNTPHGP
jgi:hypothetical protein